MSQLFAFNVADDDEPISVEGSYDPDQQLWIGDPDSLAYIPTDTDTCCGCCTDSDTDRYP